MSEQPSDKRLARGENTRRQIFDATIEVIASQGLQAVTHRAVARQAGINLSLTTYHFKDLNELIYQSLVHFTERGRPELEKQLGRLSHSLEDFAPLGDGASRSQVIQRLAQAISAYIWQQVEHNAAGLQVEMTLLFGLHQDRAMRELAHKHHQYLLGLIVDFLQPFQLPQPQRDARLILATLQSLEYEAVAGIHTTSKEDIEAQLYRQLDALLYKR